MIKRIICIFLVALFFAQYITLVNGFAKQFEGYDIVDGIVMDEEAQKKANNSDKYLVTEKGLNEDLTMENQSDSSERDNIRLLQDEEDRIYKEEERYSDQFIVMANDTGKEMVEKLNKAAKSSLNQAKTKKDKREAKRKRRLKGLDSGKISLIEEKRNQLKLSRKKNFDVKIRSVKERKIDYQIIELGERVDADIFIKQMSEEMGKEAPYIQPDIIMELQGTEVDGISDNNDAIPIIRKEFQESWNVSRGQGVMIAVIDTGIDTTHPMLKNHMITGYDFYNDKSEVYREDLGMEQAHGTHITGIIAKSAPDAKIMPLKVFENGRAYTSDIIRAIMYAEKNGATIVNISFGSTEENLALKEVIQKSGMFFVCAAGNHRTNIDETPLYPASYDLHNIISVAALNADSGMSYFSNYSERKVDISAFGRDINSTFPDGTYGVLSGTSMATGFVASAAALVFENDVMADLKKVLKRTSDRLSCLQGKVDNGNKLNVVSAVNGFINDDVIMVTPDDDFDVLADPLTPEESWELFSISGNVQVAANGDHTLVLKADGTVWSFGLNSRGQLGDGTSVNKNYPVQVIGLKGITEISCGIEYSMAMSSGIIYSWGDNSYGQLAIDTGTKKSELPITNPHFKLQDDVRGISAGGMHSMIRKGDGTVWTWGRNVYGQLGNGTTTSTSNPVRASGLANIKEISAGLQYSMALSDNNWMWTWGENTFGELGNGTRTNRTTPGQITSISSINMIYAGSYGHNMLMRTDGNVWAWGVDYIGNSETSTYSMTPLGIQNMKNILGASSGYGQRNIVQPDGSVWVWGNNEAGSIGDGTTNSRFTPVKLNGISNVKSVSSGMYHTVALKQDGTIWTWGDNYYGQLGLGINSYYPHTPSKVSFPNTTISEASEIYHDWSVKEAIQKPGEYRFYKFTPLISAKYGFGTTSNFDTYGIFYFPSGIQMSYNDDGYGAGGSDNIRDFYISYYLQRGSTYYIAVKAYSSSATGDYALKVKYIDDYGNTSENAYDISGQHVTNGAIEYPEDHDMFKFIPKKSGSHVFTSMGNNMNTIGNLYNANGALISSDSNGSGTGNFRIISSLEANNTYYLRVSHSDFWNGTGDYTIRISKPTNAIVNNYYDQAHAVRYTFSSSPTIISELNTLVNEVFAKTHNLNITNNIPIMITSTADNCKIRRGVGINQTTIGTLCPPNSGHNPVCTEWLSSYPAFISAYPGSDMKVSVLWTGNRLSNNRSFTWYDHGVAMQELFSNSSAGYRCNITTLAHELAHQFGAPDHYHEIADDGSCGGGKLCIICNPSSGRSRNCLMDDAWGTNLNDVFKVFCDGCTIDINLKLSNCP